MGQPPTREEIIEAMRVLFRTLGREQDLDEALKEAAWPDVRVNQADLMVLADPAEAGSILRRMLQSVKDRAAEQCWQRRLHRDGSPATLFGGELGAPNVFLATLRKHPPVKERRAADGVHHIFWRDTNTPRLIVPPPNRKRAVFWLARPTDFPPSERRADWSLLEAIADKTRTQLDYLRPATLNEALDLAAANPVIMEHGALLVGASYSMSHTHETALPVVRRDRRGGIETVWMPASLIIGNGVCYANGLPHDRWMMPFIQDEAWEKKGWAQLRDPRYMNQAYIKQHFSGVERRDAVAQRWSHPVKRNASARPHFKHAIGYHAAREMLAKEHEEPFPLCDFDRWGPTIFENVVRAHGDSTQFSDTVVFTGSRGRNTAGKMCIPILIVDGRGSAEWRVVPEETLFPGTWQNGQNTCHTHFLVYAK
mgnify:CR=1 FL=1